MLYIVSFVAQEYFFSPCSSVDIETVDIVDVDIDFTLFSQCENTFKSFLNRKLQAKLHNMKSTVIYYN